MNDDETNLTHFNGPMRLSLSSFRKIFADKVPHIVCPNDKMMEESCCQFCFTIQGWFDALKNSPVYDVENLDLENFVLAGFCSENLRTMKCYEGVCNSCGGQNRIKKIRAAIDNRQVIHDATELEDYNFTVRQYKQNRDYVTLDFKRFKAGLIGYLASGLKLSGSGPSPAAHKFNIKFANKDYYDFLSVLPEGHAVLWLDHANGIPKEFGKNMASEFYKKKIFRMQTSILYVNDGNSKWKVNSYNLGDDSVPRDALYTIDTIIFGSDPVFSDETMREDIKHFTIVVDGCDSQNWNATVCHFLSTDARFENLDSLMYQKTTSGKAFDYRFTVQLCKEFPNHL